MSVCPKFYPLRKLGTFPKERQKRFSWKSDKNNDLTEKNTSQDEAGVVGVEDDRGRLLKERRPVRQSRRRPRHRRQGEHQQSEEHAWKLRRTHCIF